MNFLNKDLNLAIIMLLVGTATTKAASFLSLPFLAIFLVKEVHLSPSIIGIIVGLGPLTILFGGFLGGQLSDIFGRINFLLISIFGTALTLCSFWGASHIKSHSVIIVAFGLINVLNGFISSCFQPISQALMSDLLPPEKRFKAFQLRYAAINIGAAMGPFLGAIFGISASTQAFLWSSLIFGLYGIALFIVLKLDTINLFPRTARKFTMKSSFIVVMKDRKLRYFILSGIIFFVCYAQIDCTLSQYLVVNFINGVKIFAFLLSLNALTVLFFQAPVYFLSKAYSPNVTLIIGSVIFAFGYMFFAFAGHSLLLFYIAMIIASIGEIFVFPVSGIFIDKLAPEDLRGTYFGASNFRQLGMFIGPILGGCIFQTLGGPWLFAIMSVLALSSFFINLIGDSMTNLPSSTKLLEW